MTEVLDSAPLGPLHWRTWAISAMGIFLDGLDLFVIGMALPLIIREFSPSSYQVGLIGAAAVIGAVAGAAIGGPLTDRFGRKKIYLVNTLVFVALSLLSAGARSVTALIALRFLLGVGIGADYPLCASYISDFMPARVRGRMLIGAFSFQAAGMATAALFGLAILKHLPDISAWRYMLAAGALPAAVVFFFRLGIPESARWCLTKRKGEKAAEIIGRFVPGEGERLRALAAELPAAAAAGAVKKPGYRALFSRKYFRRTALSAIPWFLMDITTYGVGIFTPILLAAMAFPGEGLDVITADFKSTEGALFLDIFLVAGFLINILLVDRWGRIRLQLLGFGGMTIGLLLLALSSALGTAGAPPLLLILAGFAIFNLLMNSGPNATTFILPAELYPTELRGTGHGFASAAGKTGAALGIFLLPVVKDRFGLTSTLILLAICAVLALVTTLLCRIETKCKSLEELSSLL